LTEGEGDGCLWIAKFTSGRDERPIERVEVATLKLARLCGLNASEAMLEFRNSDVPVALVKRFDHRGDVRIPYISARTALKRKSGEPGFYTDIADFMRESSASPVDDMRELWKRVVFTILVSNRDDHLKNHGFLHGGRGGWRLAPAFDINPSPSRHRDMETGISQGGSFESSVELAIDSCEFFGVAKEDALLEAAVMARRIGANWKCLLKTEGVSVSHINRYAPAFEHEETEKALKFSPPG